MRESVAGSRAFICEINDMVENFENEILFAARLLLGGAFVFAGLRNIQNRILVASMAARGVPQAGLALWLGIVLQIAAGLLVIGGLWTAHAATSLILFLIVASRCSTIFGIIRVRIALPASMASSAMLPWRAGSWR